jgi:septal ring factor EnvC (AmiA/AmiB activator)
MRSLSTSLAVLHPLVWALLGALPLWLASAAAQAPPVPGEPPVETGAPAPPSTDRDTLRHHEKELETLRAEQRKARENEARLNREIESLAGDQRKFKHQLIETASRVGALEERIAKTYDRLRALDDREQALRGSLDQRRNFIAEVLAALQRIGRQAPPALIVRAEDVLASVRSAMMLGAVLPEMRHKAEVLSADLAELLRLRKQIGEERVSLERDLRFIADDSWRLTLLIEERQRRQLAKQKELAEQRQRAAQVAREAQDLNQLITKLEQSLESAARAAAEAARLAEEQRSPAGKQNLAALRDPGRLTPAIAFASAKGQLPLPVTGPRIREFGAPDGLGGTEKGLSIAARPGGQITAPCDGWVVYAGVFRNYGQLLIINAGGGYHVLLAGMERISVDPGQFVVTGEPLAVMGEGAHSAAAIAGGKGQPVLYVEFRKDGVPVDPGPWWAASEGQKVRG